MTELREKQFEYERVTLNNIIIDGYNTNLMKSHLIESRDPDTANHILGNAIKKFAFFC